ncbi:MAG: hypothetical protein ACTS22_05805 [Phycisphaerales bacterium]
MTAATADTSADHDATRVPVFRVPARRLAVCSFGLGLAAATVSGLLLVASGRDPAFTAVAALACVAVGALATLLPLLLLQGRPLSTAAFAVVFSGFAGSLAAAAFGVAAFLALGLTGPGFWFVFLAGMLGVLAGKLLIVLPALRDAPPAPAKDRAR